jgi:hypothetical protein
MNRSPKRWTLLLVFASLTASLGVSASPAAANNPCNGPQERADVATLSSSQSGTRHTFTVRNFGPHCATGVKLTIDVRPHPGSVSASPSTWSCTGTQPISCALKNSKLVAPPSSASSSSLTIQTSNGLSGINARLTSSPTDPDTSNNQVWGSFGTTASSADFDAIQDQNVNVSRPVAASISINQVAAGAGLAEPAAPCEQPPTACLTKYQVMVDTPDVAVSDQWLTDPNKRIAIVISRKFPIDLAPDPTTPVYRFVDFSNTEGKTGWNSLARCDGFDPNGDPNIGCLQSVSIGLVDLTTVLVTIEVWTTHNGHYR